jgi:phospholipase/carboxylesterase
VSGFRAKYSIRVLAANVAFEGPSREFGEPFLRLKDPDGLIVKLVGIDMPTPAPRPDAPTRLRGVTVLMDKAAETEAFPTRFGYRHAQRADLGGASVREIARLSICDSVGHHGYSGYRTTALSSD